MKVGIRLSLVFTVSVSMIFIMVISTGYNVVTRSQQEMERLEEKANLSSTLQMTGVAQSLWDYDTDATQRLTEAFATDPDFAAAWVEDTSGDRVASYIPDEAVAQSKDTTTVTKPVMHPKSEEPLGTMTLVLSHERLQEIQKNLIFVASVQMLVAVGILLALIYAAAGSVTNPINRLTEIMRDLASGDHSKEIPYQEKHNEIGQIAKAVQVFKENAEEKEKLEKQQKETAIRNQEEKKQMLAGIADKLDQQVNRGVTDVNGLVDSLRSVFTDVSKMNNTTNEQCRTALDASTASLDAVQSVNSATTEMSSSIQEIQTQAQNSTNESKDAVEKTENAKKMVLSLQESAEKIGSIVTLIQDVAEQTNLLALNATIEAARAGEAGKGFAVVASEVKALAQQTTRASEDISDNINEIQGMINDTAFSIESVTDIVSHLNQSAGVVENSVSEQMLAIKDIAQNMSHVSDQSTTIQDNIESVSKAAHSMGNSVGKATESINHIVKSIDDLSEMVRVSIQDIRSA